MSRLSQLDMIGIAEGGFISRKPITQEDFKRHCLEKELSPEKRKELAEKLRDSIAWIEKDYLKRKPKLEDFKDAPMSPEEAFETMLKVWEQKRSDALTYNKIQFQKNHPDFYIEPDNLPLLSKPGEFSLEEARTYLEAIQSYLGEKWAVRFPKTVELTENDQTVWTADSSKETASQKHALRVVVVRR